MGGHRHLGRGRPCPSKEVASQACKEKPRCSQGVWLWCVGCGLWCDQVCGWHLAGMLTISFYAAIQAGCVRAHAWLVCRCSQTSPPVQKPSTFPTSSFFCLNTCGTKTHFAVRRGVVCKLALTNTRRSTLLEGARSTCPAAPTPPTTPETTAKTDDPPNTASLAGFCTSRLLTL